MSIETDAAASDAIERADELAADLGAAIADLPEYRQFAEAKAAVEADEEAQEAISEFETIRNEFVVARQTGEATQEDLMELQNAQQDLHEIPVMSDYLAAQSELELRLQDLNQTISEELAIDFGEKAGGCCAD